MENNRQRTAKLNHLIKSLADPSEAPSSLGLHRCDKNKILFSRAQGGLIQSSIGPHCQREGRKEG